MDRLMTSMLSALLLAPACHVFGLGAQQLKLPQITGYILAGVLCGPFVLGLLTEEAAHRLWFVDQACLSVIALAAGAELQWDQLEKIHKQVVLITLCISSATWLWVFLTVLALTPLIPLAANMDATRTTVFCSLCATLMIARSPASALAVLQETGGKGAFCSLVMAVIVVKDVFTIVAFALNIELARAASSVGRGSLRLYPFLDPFVSVVAAVVLGLLAALAFDSLVWVMARLPRTPLLPLAKKAAVMLLATAVFETATLFEAEPLLACATAGLVASNTLKEVGREELHASLAGLMLPVNLAFFSLAGASLDLHALVHTLWLASAIVLARAAAVWVGSYVGCWASDAPPEQRKHMWQCMLTQAGVALGLARMVAKRFPGWGTYFQTLMVSAIVLNLVTGPPLFRNAIISMGESRHGHRESPVSQATAQDV